MQPSDNLSRVAPEFKNLIDLMFDHLSRPATRDTDAIKIFEAYIQQCEVPDERKITLTGFMFGVYLSFLTLFPGGKEEFLARLLELKIARVTKLAIVKGDTNGIKH